MQSPVSTWGTVDNSGPGSICQVCSLGPEADVFARRARANGNTYDDIASALGRGAGREVSPKSLWHHLKGAHG